MYSAQGQYEKSSEVFRECLRVDPNYGNAYDNLANSLLALQRFDEAQRTIQQADRLKMEDFLLHTTLYALAFLRANSAAMTAEQQWFKDRPEENIELSLGSDTEAYAGRLGKARELTKRSVEFAIHADSKETGAIWYENAALREAAFGNAMELDRKRPKA